MLSAGMTPNSIPVTVAIRAVHASAVGRQGARGCALGFLEQAGPRARLLADRPAVQPREQVADGGVGVGDVEELAMAQGSENPTLGDLNTALHCRFVARTSRARRDHAHAVVQREVLIGGIEIGIVSASFGDAGLGVIGSDDLGRAAKEVQRPHVSAEPSFHLLVMG